MSLEHIVVPESKEVHTKKKTRKGKKRTPRWGYIKGAKSQLKELPMAKTGSI